MKKFKNLKPQINFFKSVGHSSIKFDYLEACSKQFIKQQQQQQKNHQFYKSLGLFLIKFNDFEAFAKRLRPLLTP